MTTKKQRLHVPAGKLFCTSRGRYSDYGYTGHFLALVDLTPTMFRDVEAECKAAAGADINVDAEDAFLPALVRRGWVLDIDCVEIHTGEYGELNLS